MNRKPQSERHDINMANPASGPVPQARNADREAAAALNFWQALEYLAPQAPPAAKVEDCVWELSPATPDAGMPWNDPVKQLALDQYIGPKRRFQLFSGIVGGVDLVETARAYLGAGALDMSERPPPKPAACVMLSLNGAGMATGEVFVSTVPWAMARLAHSGGTTAAIDFRGFLGLGALEQRIQEKVQDLLVELKLLAENPAAPQPAAETDQSSLSLQDETPLRPVAADDVAAVTDLVFELCGWRPAREAPWCIKAFKASEKEDDNRAAQDNPLNSFYAEDLERLSAALKGGDIGAGLREYLRGEDASDRIDLEHDIDALIEGVHPSRQPRGCWPASHPLVTAQQFAVNTVMRKLGPSEGMFSVNGPPGTGKTTMLKDIVAAIVVDRADVLAEFDHPASAFQGKLEIDDYPYRTCQLDERLRGFGVVVASANNGAVENISRELPGLGAIAPGLEVDYFSIVADSLAAPAKARRRSATAQSWGMIAAVLGSKENRKQFVNRFWFAGTQPKNKKDEPLDPLRLRSVKELIQAREEGAMPWELARTRYRQAAHRVETLLAQAGAAVEAVQARRIHTAARDAALASAASAEARMTLLLAAAQAAHGAAHAAAAQAREAAAKLAIAQRLSAARGHAAQLQRDIAAREAELPSDGLDGAKLLHARALADIQHLRDDHDRHLRVRPGFFSQLFRTEFSRRWNARGEEFEGQLRQARLEEQSAAARVLAAASLAKTIDDMRPRLASAQEQVERAEDEALLAGFTAADSETSLRRQLQASTDDVESQRLLAANTESTADAARREIQVLRQAIAQAEADLFKAEGVLDQLNLRGDALHAWDLKQLDRETRHSIAPYACTELFAARRDLFIAAMDLHKAFIVASWDRLECMLRAFVNVLGGSVHPGRVRDGVAHLWDAFFLVVPLVSTTFASFPRLFTGIRREQLAWLLVDEAGQATPQQAAGGIWRARRSVIVGDPLQLEPVVGVPEELMTPLLERCRAEPQWAPPATSAQTLADRANRHGMYLGKDGSDETVWLGSPLLVHRRCLDPMFGIANNIAYENKMVYGAGRDNGPAGIGPSCWIDMPATHAEGHWVEAQGRKALELVERITGGVLRSNGQFKVYVITPFRTVAQKMHALLQSRYKEESKGMAGTVHTFQGKEAEHVIFLLGGNPKSPGVIATFAGKKPNLVNVAVTRAKRRLYVIGDRSYWTGAGDVHRIYSRMARQLAPDEGNESDEADTADETGTPAA